MRTIISIIHVEEKLSRVGDIYHRTHALLDDGTEAIGFGKDFNLGDHVMVFFDHGQIKMAKP